LFYGHLVDFGNRRCDYHYGGGIFDGMGKMNADMKSKNQEYIDIAANRMMADQVEQLRAELEQAREIISGLSAKLNERFTRCTYCGYKIDYNADSEAETISAMFEINRHALTCEKDPRAKELEQARAHLGNLLAVIHGDGGQYQAEYGDLAATTDAILKWRGAMLRIGEIEEAARWIPVSDPPNGESGEGGDYIIATKFGHVFEAEHHYSDHTWHAGTRQLSNVTHYRPLPTPPEAQS
jgi:hypothetical protein